SSYGGSTRHQSQAAPTESASSWAPEPANEMSKRTSKASRRTRGGSPTLEPRTRGSVEPADPAGRRSFMEFKDYVRIVLSHWVGVVLLCVFGVVAAAGYNATQPKVYQASASGLVATVDPSDTGGQKMLDDQLAKSRAVSYVAIATSTDVADLALQDSTLEGTGLPQTAGALIGHISVDQPLNTVLIKISARAATP